MMEMVNGQMCKLVHFMIPVQTLDVFNVHGGLEINLKKAMDARLRLLMAIEDSL